MLRDSDEAANKRAGVSLVIPTYRSARFIGDLVFHCYQILTRSDEVFEIVIVDDRSEDRTPQVISVLSRQFPGIKTVFLKTRAGQWQALCEGVEVAAGEVVVTMDDDFEHPPEAIPRLVEKVREGFDLVYADPLRRRKGLLRNVTSRLVLGILTKKSGLAAIPSPFRGFRYSLWNTARREVLDGKPLDLALGQRARAQTSVRIEFGRSRRARSSYSAARLFRLFVNSIQAVVIESRTRLGEKR